MTTLSNELRELINMRNNLPEEFSGTYWHHDRQDVDNALLIWVLENSTALIDALEYAETENDLIEN